MTITALDAPVTVTVTRRAPVGRDSEVHAWLEAGLALAENFPGFLGGGWLRPAAGSEDWHVLYRFADSPALAVWEDSPQRAGWLASADELMTQTRAEKRTGIEGWFDAPDEVHVVVPKPPRWKQMVVIYCAFFPLSLLSALFLAPHLVHLPVALRVLASTLCLTPVMTYLALPRVTKTLEWWLQGRPAPWRSLG